MALTKVFYIYGIALTGSLVAPTFSTKSQLLESTNFIALLLHQCAFRDFILIVLPNTDPQPVVAHGQVLNNVGADKNLD